MLAIASPGLAIDNIRVSYATLSAAYMDHICAMDKGYDEAAFWAKYGGATYRGLKERYDPQGRLLDLYAKAVRRR